jgi:hypothetical protein
MSETEANDTYTAKAAPFAVRQKGRLASIPAQAPQSPPRENKLCIDWQTPRVEPDACFPGATFSPLRELK